MSGTVLRGTSSEATSSRDVDDHVAPISVLIVDETPLTSLVHEKILTELNENVFVKHKFNILMVANGTEASDLHQSGSSFDLILIDWESTVLDGPQATSQLRTMGVQSVIVGMSPDDDEDGEKKKSFLNAGVNDYYKKPMCREQLMFVLQNLVMINK